MIKLHLFFTTVDGNSDEHDDDGYVDGWLLSPFFTKTR
jgi:hypothetical protein